MELAGNLYVPLAFVLIGVWYVYKLPYYYYVARQTKLPIYFCPLSPANLFWVISLAHYQPWLARYLPRFIYKRLRACIDTERDRSLDNG